jgi:hypothetical protein
VFSYSPTQSRAFYGQWYTPGFQKPALFAAIDMLFNFLHLLMSGFSTENVRYCEEKINMNKILNVKFIPSEYPRKSKKHGVWLTPQNLENLLTPPFQKLYKPRVFEVYCTVGLECVLLDKARSFKVVQIWALVMRNRRTPQPCLTKRSPLFPGPKPVSYLPIVSKGHRSSCCAFD